MGRFGPRPWGPDVSRWQSRVDWHAVAAAGASFGIAKATQYRKDAWFDFNWGALKAAGLVRGAYLFAMARGVIAPQAQAAGFAAAVDGLGPADLGPIIDFEADPSTNTIPSPRDIIEIAHYLRTLFPDKRVIVYGSRGPLTDLARAGVPEFCDLWVARYGKNTGSPSTPDPFGWPLPRVLLWQFTSRGRCDGIGGDCDLNLWHADELALRAYARGGRVVMAGSGYWLLARDGAVYSFGGVDYHGGANPLPAGEEAVDLIASPTGSGYWILTSTGGVYSFGDAEFHGSLGADTAHAPIVGGAFASPD